MDDSSPGGPFAWMAPSLVKHDKISAIEPISQSIWRIYRPGMTPFILGILGVESVTLADVNRLLSQGIAIDMVANVPKESRWEGAAIVELERLGIAWGKFGDIYRAASNEIPRQWKGNTRSFVERALGQHRSIKMLTPVTDMIYQVSRIGMRDITFVMIHQYTLTAEDVRHARALHGDFDEILNTDPNGTSTSDAVQAAKSLNASIFSMSQLMGRLSNS